MSIQLNKTITILGTFIFCIQTNYSQLDLNQIMGGDDFIGHQPINIRWTSTGEKVLFDWNPNNLYGNTPYSYELKSATIDSLGYEDLISQPTADAIKNDQVILFTSGGHLFVKNRKDNQVYCAIKAKSHIYNLQFNATTDKFYFQQDDGFFSFCPKDGSTIQLVQFVKGSPQSEQAESYLSKEEKALFQFIRDQRDESEWNAAIHKTITETNNIPQVYYQSDRFSNVQISGDGKHILYRLDNYPNDIKTEVQHHISEDGHSYINKARAKVFNHDPNHELFIYNMDQDTTIKVDFSTLPSIRTVPQYYALYPDLPKAFDKDRNIIMHELIFNQTGNNNVVDIRSYDNKDRWIATIDITSGKLSIIDHQHDDAWIGGPGISGWNMVNGNIGWIDNDKIYFQSEASGYSHLYMYNFLNQNTTQLTKGKWEVYDVSLSQNNKTLYVTANKTHPGDRGFYHLDIATKKLQPILTDEGAYEVTVSPNEKYLAVRYSYKNKPWELFICSNTPNPKLTQITNSQTQKFKSYNWMAPEVITLTTEENTPVYARVYKPDESIKNNAAVIFVHGAGYLQNAHNYWSVYHREYMFHNLLADLGYTVIDIDYRASEGYGRDHRTAIYRHMGGSDLDDQIIGKEYLVNQLGIDENRVGIYGGSYGGFITLMALLTKPGEFKCGAALRSVTDFTHYNHEYTSNILNYPSLDPHAYRISSPIYFAENLQDRLIMLHGMVDDNVQFQDVVRLSQRFIELGKTNWDLAVFPVEAHGFKQTYSWVDEYRRILELFNQELLNQ